MLSFLFWNINNKNLCEQIHSIVKNNDIDVLALAESKIPPQDILNELNSKAESEYFYHTKLGCSKVDIYTRFSKYFMKIIYEKDRITIRQLSLPNRPDLLLAIMHYPDKRNYKPSEQASHCKTYLEYIRIAEQMVGHERTIFYGDFNMNPFEEGVVSSDGLHAVLSKRIAKKEKRVVDDNECPFFYNPMWNLFGDSKDGPPGSYYYYGSTPLVYFWHIFDQVLIRPDLIDYFNNNELKILTSYGEGVKLTNRNGIPNSRRFSDHLPLFFCLNL